MAIPFLNNINLSDNQLLNAKLQVTSTAPTAAVGQIYFDSTAADETAKYYSNVTDTWVSLKEYTFPAGGFITGTITGTTPKPIITFDLNAVDGTAIVGERYLTKSNTWAEVSGITGTTYDLEGVGSTNGTAGVRLTGSDATADDVLIIGAGTTTVTRSGNTLTVTSNDQFTGTVTSVGLSMPAAFTVANSPITGSGTLAVTGAGATSEYIDGTGALQTFPTIPGAYTWTVSDGTNSTAVASGETVTFSGTANEIEVAESGRTVTIGLPNDVTIANNLTVGGTGSFTGQVTIPILPISSTDAASKDYVDNAVIGGLVYQGGYNAATNTPDLTTSPNSILKGWTYTVTVDGTFFGEQLRVGDVLIAEVDDPSALDDWTTVQNNIDLASLTQVGIGNVKPDPATNLGGIAVSYTGNAGTAFVGLGIAALGVDPLAETPADYFIPIYNSADDENKKVASSDLLNAINSATSYATTITDTATISHGLASSDVMVQLYDITTGETVYADVDRISTTQVTITFAATPTNSVRVLVQKIG